MLSINCRKGGLSPLYLCRAFNSQKRVIGKVVAGNCNIPVADDEILDIVANLTAWFTLSHSANWFG
jgi:hypothetical protein